MHCPRCTYPLGGYRDEDAQVDHCDRCQGSFFEPGAAPRHHGPGTCPSSWRDLWVTSQARPATLKCPRDGSLMLEHQVTLGAAQVDIDVCPTCQGMWLDRGEGETLSSVLSDASAEKQRAEAGASHHGIAGYLFQFFTHLPIEVWNPVRRRPVLVYGLCIALTLLFFAQLAFGGALSTSPGLLMLVPAEVAAGTHSWTLFTYGFLHGGWFHLLGNLYFLWLFGDNVEDKLGRRDFMVLYTSALLAGGMAHLLTNPHSAAPMLGASGAVAGLMGAYLVLFPRVQVWVVVFIVRLRIGVGFYLAFWIGLQIVMQVAGAGGTAWMAHLGGFAMGAVAALVLGRSQRGTTAQPSSGGE